MSTSFFVESLTDGRREPGHGGRRRRGSIPPLGPSTDNAKVRLSAIDDSEFVDRVAATPDEQLAETMRGELRDDILDEIFARMQQHFEPSHAKGVDAVVAWNICGRPDGECDCYQMRIRDGACQVSPCCAERPDASLTLDPVSFLKLAAGQAGGPGLMLRGKLRPRGDISLARRLQDMFRLPTTTSASAGTRKESDR